MARPPRRSDPDPTIRNIDADPVDALDTVRASLLEIVEEDARRQERRGRRDDTLLEAVSRAASREDSVLEVVQERPARRDDTVLEAVPPTWGEVTRAADRVRWLEGELGRDIEPHARVSLLLELGEVYWQDLEEAALAERAYGEALRLDPSSAEAFEALDQIYVVTWQADKRIELLVNRTEQLESPAEQAALLQRVAGLYVELDQLDKAIITLETARGLDPDNRELAAEHDRLTRPPEPTQPKDLLELLELQVAAEGDPRARVELWERMASLHQQRGQGDAAARCLEQILAVDPRRLSCYQRLEQQHLEGQRFEELAAVLERHVRVAAPDERARLHGQLAKLYEGPLRDAGRARLAYQALLRVAPNHAPALQALLRLSEQAGEWPTVAQLLEAVVGREALPAARADLLHRLACVQLEHLGQPEAAEDSLLRALTQAPAHPAAVARLAEIYRARSDWGKLVKLLLESEAASGSARERVTFLFQAGQAVLDELGDETRAIELFERVLALDPDHAPAAAPLSERYWREGRREECLPLLELLARKIDRGERDKVIEIHFRLAVSERDLEHAERAERHFLEVLALDPGHAGSLLGLADLAYAAGEWSEALSTYDRAQRAGALQGPEAVEVLHRSGRCAQQLGRRSQAIELFEAALRRAPGHAGVAEALAALQGESENWDAVLVVKRGLAAAAPEGRRPELHRELAQICWRRLNRPADAERELQQALALRPDDHGLLHDLIDLYSETSRWPQTVEACRRMAGLEPEPRLRAKYHHTIAVIYRDKLDEADRAVEYFNRVLDDDPGQLQAFEAIDALCTRRRAWKQLEQAYARMIQRLPGEGHVKLKAMLWHNLGEILRSRRRDFETAARAFEAAAALEPDNLQRLRILVELYQRLGAPQAHKLRALRHELLRREPRVVDHYRELRRLYMEGQQYDRAWCLCMGLSLVKLANREEQGFYQQYRRQRLPEARRPLTDELWRRNVLHPSQPPLLTAVLAAVAPIVGGMTARPAAQYGLKARDLRQAEHEELPVVRVIDLAAAALGVARPIVYLRPDRPEGLLRAHTQTAPSLVVGARALRGVPDKELAFLVGKELAFLRPEHFLRHALPAAAQLQAVLLAVLKLFQPELVLSSAQGKALAPLLERLGKQLQPAVREQLGRLVARLCAESPPGDASLAAWCRAIELTSDRVGFLLCNDLEIAAKLIGESAPGETSASERIGQLLQYACSEPYFELRAKLGIDLDA